jgi:hypothetical protein
MLAGGNAAERFRPVRPYQSANHCRTALDDHVAVDPKATGLPRTHRDTGTYIMWAGSPYAHVHVMGRPERNQ